MPQPVPERALRGFDWRLIPLQRKRSWELEAARLALAGRVGQWQAAQAAQDDAQAALDAASQQCRQALASRPDPQVHQRLLAHLVQLGNELTRRTAAQSHAAQQLEAARHEFMQKQQDFDVLAQAYAKALDAHHCKQMQREQSEADASWLARQRLHVAEAAVPQEDA